MSKDWIWHQNDHTGVAHFINPNVKNLLPIKNNFYDLRNHNPHHLTPVIKLLYNELKAQGIRYSNEKGMTDDDEAQSIRKPNEILGGNKEGTCLDLALLFCGLCLGHRLLPIFVLLEKHALVAVSLKFTASERSSLSRPMRLLLEDGAVTNANNGLDYLSRLVDEKHYVLIECTGFAQTETISNDYPEGQQRVDGFLGFEQAVEAGYKQLNCRAIKFFLDIEIAHRILKKRPYQIISVEPKYVNAELLENVKYTSISAREALNPRYLERISRTVVQEKYIPAIQRSLEGDSRVIFIYAPAGYGKSVILGEIYDELIKVNSGWICLTLCAYLSKKPIDSIKGISEALGESICLKKEPIEKIALNLNNTYGKGVILIDTLDLILTSELIPHLRGVLLKLIKVNATVVFTCREEEYKFLRSKNAMPEDAMAGIKVDHYQVSRFTEEEVRNATNKFINKKKQIKGQHINDKIFENFTKQIFELSAGAWKAGELDKIIHSPLLLGMLCELFAGKKENVPDDLTVSNLYDQYWHEKIKNHRTLGNNSYEAKQKEKLCLAIAEGFFKIFIQDNKFQDNANEDDLEIDWERNFIEARKELMTEGVIETLPTDTSKIRFFHQTLLEYAVARWLQLKKAESNLNDLLKNLKQADWAYKQLYWYVIIRQLLTRENDEKFDEIFKNLDIKNQQPAFHAVVFAAASRDEPSALKKLLPVALELTDSHQEALRQAVVSASLKLASIAYDIMLSIMQQGQRRPAVNAAKTTGDMLSRWWGSLGERLDETLEAISKRKILNEKNQYSTDQRPEIFGCLILELKFVLEKKVDINTLRTFRKYYCLWGYRLQPFLIQLYLAPEVSKEDRKELLNIFVAEPVPTYLPIQEARGELLEKVLSDLVPFENLSKWGSWLAELNPEQKQLPKGWDQLQGKAVGHLIAGKFELLAEIIKNVFGDTQANVYCCIQAIEAAVHRGAGSYVADIILDIKFETILPERYNTLDGLLRNIASYLISEQQETIAKWLEPLARNSPRKFTPAVDALADKSLFARQLLAKLIPELPPEKQVYQEARMLRFYPLEQHPPLNKFDKESQLFLVYEYRRQAQTQTSLEALRKLLNAATPVTGASKNVVYAALEDIEKLADGRLKIEDWLPLLKAAFPKARKKSLEAINQIKQSLKDAELTEICSILANEKDQQVVISLCKLVKPWINAKKRVPPMVAEAIGDIPTRLGKNFDGGTMEELIPTLTAIAQSEDRAVIPQQLVEWTCTLFKAININKGESKQNPIKLLCAVDRLDENFLALLVNDDCPKLAENKWEKNLCAVVGAIERTKKLYLLEPILALARKWELSELEDVILKIKMG